MTVKKDNNCGKCGLCLAVCPVHKVLLEEEASPRAKIQLIKSYRQQNLPSSPYLQELIGKCLMCGSCTASCPSGVDHYGQFIDMREKMVGDHGDKVEIRGLVFLLAREQRLRLAAQMARWGQEIIPERFLKKYRLANIPIKRFPRLNKKPFRAAVPEISPSRGKNRGTVLYFTGCATNYIYDETGHATLRLLTSMGYTVIIPKKQTCCSIPMLFHGAVSEAEQNIRTNIACLHRQDLEAIIVDCPTCGSALKNEYPAMLQRFGGNEALALAVAAKTTDLLSFIHDRLDLLQLDRGGQATSRPVTYHAPCHLRNSFVPAARVLQALPQIDYVPAADALECCGGGGTFFYEYPELAGKMAEKKIANARKTGAGLWLTDCPVCRINLFGQLTDEDAIEMQHPAEYLDSLLSG